MRYRWAAAFNRFLGDKVMTLAATRNEPGEKVGFINRVFGLVYPIRVCAKAVKEYNRNLYYSIKYIAIAVLVVLIVF
jgi:beta-hydroxylase